ncbi:hypothetical protein [Psychrobacillus sp. OK032]|uniref:hypothetical protein n=1 Tax=Psychrobacillus sp. OK032 TaxID=1884358 RepID=UPI0008C563D7|nr:hypothetical protein [Psychrobacillus sp. OK032]SES17368.1 hypothetical protein SAMN05518872_10586 [Psychrobacillus sp. OK032]
MKKNEFQNMETAEANIELNEIMNEDNKLIYRKGASSATEANIALQEEFYAKNNQEQVLPTYISNNDTPVIIVTGKDK